MGVPGLHYVNVRVPGGRGLGGTLSLWLVGRAHTADGHRAPARTFPRGSLLCALRPWLRDVVHAKAPMPSLLDGTMLARLDDDFGFCTCHVDLHPAAGVLLCDDTYDWRTLFLLVLLWSLPSLVVGAVFV